MANYATVTAFKARIGITDTTDDTTIGQVLEAVSRWIDNYCGRGFGQSVAGKARYYTPQRSDYVLIDDCVSLTEVATDDDGDRTYEYTWTATDYDLLPDNASMDGLPYDRIEVTPDGDYTFPTVRKGLKLTGTWGWPDVPAPIFEACLLQAARVFKRRDSPQGIMGSGELGFVRVSYRLDPDVQQMIDPYRRLTVV